MIHAVSSKLADHGYYIVKEDTAGKPVDAAHSFCAQFESGCPAAMH
jgi:hypothetical protein